MSTLNMTTSRYESFAISQIARRAVAYYARYGADGPSSLEIQMDLSALHAGECPLDLGAMQHASDFDLMHDVAGIHANLNRQTGQLMNLFVPRFALPEAKGGAS